MKPPAVLVREKWKEVSSLTVYEAALLRHGIDPDIHAERMSEQSYAAYFESHNISDQVDITIGALFDAISSGTLAEAPQSLRLGDEQRNAITVRILMSGYLNWLSGAANSPIERLIEDLSTTPERDELEDKSPETADPENTNDNIEPDDLPIPGKLPRTAIGKLAIEAAWKIELNTGRKALARDVMNTLSNWAENGEKPDVLVRSERSLQAVFWQTFDRSEKRFDVENCGRALTTWQRSRN